MKIVYLMNIKTGRILTLLALKKTNQNKYKNQLKNE